MLAAFMALAVVAPAWAADTGSITVKPSDTVPVNTKTLKAYKILDATYSGTGANQKVSYSIPNSMKNFFDTYFGDATHTASQLAAADGKTLETYVSEQMTASTWTAGDTKDFSVAALAAAKAAGITATTGTVDGDNVVFSPLAPGYYVIEDTATEEPISAVMLDTVTDSDVEITLKASDKTQKKIKTAEELINEKANELGLGRAVNYEVTQVIPDTTGYDYYYFLINDVMSTGLTFNNDVKVYVDKNKDGDFEDDGELLTAGTDYYLYYKGNPANTDAINDVLGDKTFIVAFKDVVADIAAGKYAAGDDIMVTYSGTINASAVTGVDPLNNKVNVQYSNNPDKDERGDKIPGVPLNDEDHPTGEGPWKHTVSYSTKVSIIKIDGETEEKLEGVDFTLTGTSKDAVFNLEEVFEIDPAGDYWLLKDGTYTTTAPQTVPTLVETVGSAGWVEMAQGETYNGTIRVVDGKQYRPYVSATDSAKTRYIIHEPNDNDYASVTTKYAKVTKTADDAESYLVSRTGTTDGNGAIDFAQLGAGTYKLSETGILPGYNGIVDIEFTIECDLPDAADVIAGNEECEWRVTSEQANVSFVEDPDHDGNFIITLVNNSGQELPSTGGMGTTILYIVGGIMLVGGAIVLISKRRVAGLEK